MPPPPLTPESSTTARWSGPPRSVLVVDDDHLIVRAVVRQLRGAGLLAHGTSDPDEALAWAERAPPDVVISDLHMPNACGAALLTTLAELIPGALRVLMTADPQLRPDVGSLVDARLHALMAKPDLRALARVVMEQLRGRLEEPAEANDREALAVRIADACARAPHESAAHRARLLCGTAAVGAAMGLLPGEIAEGRLAALLHDVGQIALRDPILTRTGALSAAEREEIATHADAGARIVEAMPALRGIAPLIRAHHERADGDGYPLRLPGSAIPRAARALQVVDAYDAMTTGRPHARGRSHDEAMRELLAGAGRQHDPDAVAALAALGPAALAATG